MRRLFALSLAALALAFGSPAVAAQDATPVPAGALLAALGYPELRIEVAGAAYELPPPAQLPAGRYLVTLANVGQESWHGFLLRLPAGVTDEQVAVDLGPETEAPPGWLFEATFPASRRDPARTDQPRRRRPGAGAVPGGRRLRAAVRGRGRAGDAEAAAEPGADGAVGLFEYGFQFPETVESGRHVWAVTNDGQEPHEVLLAWSPEPVTAEQIVEMFTNESEDENATPVGGGPSFAEIAPVGGLGWLSPGMTAWTEVDLEPGTVIALCFVFDPATGMPHVAMGMVAVVAVGEGARRRRRHADAVAGGMLLSPLRPHDLRHTFAVHLATATNADAYELERRLGHRSQRDIQRYTNPPEDIAAADVEEF